MSEGKQLQQTDRTNIAVGTGGVQLNDISEMMRFAEVAYQSKLVPKSYTSREQVFIGIQAGMELGLKPMQALAGIMVVNQMPTVWGDTLLGLVRNSDVCEYVIESYDAETKTATCRCKRKGSPEETLQTFSYDEAKAAQLLGKDTWKKFPRRMLQMRARSWALRDCFPDVTKGMLIAEEALDIEREQSKEAPTIQSGDIAPTKTIDTLLDAVDEDDAKQEADSEALEAIEANIAENAENPDNVPSEAEQEAIRQAELKEASELF